MPGAQPEVHVVGDQGRAVAGQRAGDGEIVASDRPRLQVRRAGQVRVRVRLRQGAQVDGVGARELSVADRFADQGRVPARACVGHQRVKRVRKVRPDPPQRQFALVAGVLQVEVHREPDQHGVLGSPALGHRTQRQVGPRPCAEGGESCVHAFGIRLQQGAIAFLQVPDRGLGARAHPVHAARAVGVQGRRAEEGGELARGRASHQVHLEVALLGVHVAQGTHGVALVAGVDGGHAQRVARDGNLRAESRQDRLALELRQAGPHRPPRGERGQQDDDGQKQGDAQDPADHRLPPRSRCDDTAQPAWSASTFCQPRGSRPPRLPRAPR